MELDMNSLKFWTWEQIPESLEAQTIVWVAMEPALPPGSTALSTKAAGLPAPAGAGWPRSWRPQAYRLL